MKKSQNIQILKTLSCELLENAITDIQSEREKSDHKMKERFFTAEYILLEGKEYIEGAWDMFISKKYNASISLSRWILEASLNLLWTIADDEKIEERLKILVGEALRYDACLLESLAKLWPDKSSLFLDKANEARKIRKTFSVEKPRSLDERLEEIRQHKTTWPELYPLYRICCASAHPNLKVWDRFVDIENKTVSQKPIDKNRIACWMVSASTLYLVTYSYCLTRTGDAEQLKDWWKNKISPLLNDE